MKVCYCKQASGGAITRLRNQETPRGTKIWQQVGVRVHFPFKSKSTRSWFLKDETHDTRLLIRKDKADISGLFTLFCAL